MQLMYKYWDVNKEWDKRADENGWPRKQTVYTWLGHFNNHDVWVDERYKKLSNPTFVAVASSDLDDYNAGALTAFTWCEEKGLFIEPDTKAILMARDIYKPQSWARKLICKFSRK